jgi:hypothetical protein
MEVEKFLFSREGVVMLSPKAYKHFKKTAYSFQDICISIRSNE